MDIGLKPSGLRVSSETLAIYVDFFFFAEHRSLMFNWVSTTAQNSQIKVHAVPKWLRYHQCLKRVRTKFLNVYIRTLSHPPSLWYSSLGSILRVRAYLIHKPFSGRKMLDFFLFL